MDTQLKSYLHSWNILNGKLASLDEQELKQLLNFERRGRNRPYLVKRIHQRYTSVRAAREREELLK